VWLWMAFWGACTLLACDAQQQTDETPPSLQEESLPLFVDVTEEAGLRWRHRSGSLEKNHILAAKGGGTAFLDYDGDGYLDIYLVNGATSTEPEKVLHNVLYRNEGDGHFADVTKIAGVDGAGWGMGCVAADYDNDGDTDLYITNYGPNQLYRNEGDGRFADVTKIAGLGDSSWSTGAAFGDYDLDGDLDLYVANYLDFDPESPQPEQAFCQWKSLDVFCGPRSLHGAADRLYRNEGNGRFVDVTKKTGLQDNHKYYGFQVLFSDYDLDGWPDLFVANDSTPNLLYHNEGNGTFREIGIEAGVAYSAQGKGQAGMGAAFGDYDGDGFPDLFVTHFASDYNTLYHNEAGHFFLDTTLKVRLGDKSRPYVSWGTCFLDYDLDADLDLFVANGHVYPRIDQLQLGEETYRQPNQLFKNQGNGIFVEVRGVAALQDRRVSRGSSCGDYDNDGDLDLLVLNLDDYPTLMRNDHPSGHWLLLRLSGRQSNRDGIGARVAVYSEKRRQVREVAAGSSFLGTQDPRLHFGLGSQSWVDSLEVRWPSGAIDRLYDLEADRLIVLEEGGKILNL